MGGTLVLMPPFTFQQQYLALFAFYKMLEIKGKKKTKNNQTTRHSPMIQISGNMIILHIQLVLGFFTPENQHMSFPT